MQPYFGSRKTSIILAADLPTLDDNLSLIDRVADHVDVIKIASPLVYREGARAIRAVADRSHKPVFADLKVADVPHTDARIVDLVRRFGGAAVMVHGFVGPDALEDCMEAARDQIGIIVQLELTNPGGAMFTQPIAEDMARLAREIGVYGVQAPGNRPDRIRAIRGVVGPEMTVVCCGVGAQGGTYGTVLASGGTYAIIGRSIYEAADPVRAIYQILASSTPGDTHDIA
jgi:orotidine-5'-phosphate decarboxylase